MVDRIIEVIWTNEQANLGVSNMLNHTRRIPKVRTLYVNLIMNLYNLTIKVECSIRCRWPFWCFLEDFSYSYKLYKHWLREVWEPLQQLLLYWHFLDRWQSYYANFLTTRPWAERSSYSTLGLFFFCHVCRLNQTSLSQNLNDATYDVQGQQKSQITKIRFPKKVHSKPWLRSNISL